MPQSSTNDRAWQRKYDKLLLQLMLVEGQRDWWQSVALCTACMPNYGNWCAEHKGPLDAPNG